MTWERERALRDVRSSLLDAIDSTDPDRDVLVRSLLERFEDEATRPTTGVRFAAPPTAPASLGGIGDPAAVALAVCVAVLALILMVWAMAGPVAGLVMVGPTVAGVAAVVKGGSR